MNLMEEGLQRYLKPDEMDKISKTTIGIAGCGGLGSNTAHALVRLGYKNFHLVDFDIVEPSNLNRQFFFYDQLGEVKCEALKVNLLRINPDLDIRTSNTKVEKENIRDLFNGIDIVVEGFDGSNYKKMIIEELGIDKNIVTASGLGNYWNTDEIKTIKVSQNLTVIGDFKSDVESGVVPLSPGVYTSSAKQAAAVLEMTLKEIKC